VGRKKRQRVATDGSDTGGSGGGLGALFAAKGFVASTPSEPSADAPSSTDTPGWSEVGKVIVRRTRKGRGGKTVTLVEGLPAAFLAQASKELGRGLGVGARVEEEAVVVQGDQCERLQAWLVDAGVTRVVRGS
jgi:translation initiation factor 1